MRTRVDVVGWQPGLRKIELTKLIREHGGYSLARAKAATDAILEGEEVTVEVDGERREDFVRRLKALGAIVRDE